MLTVLYFLFSFDKFIVNQYLPKQNILKGHCHGRACGSFSNPNLKSSA